MPDKELPAQPSLEQYKKQAKELKKSCKLALPEALARIRRYHPGFRGTEQPPARKEISLSDAQLVIAREHGFESWPKFKKQLEMLNAQSDVASLDDPVAAFVEAATVPRQGSHVSGTLEKAELILSRYPYVAAGSIYTAAILADEAAVRRFLSRDRKSAIAKGGPYSWDALTYLCFSRYLRLDQSRSQAFVRTARVLLEAGASPNTGWHEMIDQPPRPLLETVMYGAAAIARHPELTRLLLEHGADPNDEETPYHVPEGYDNTIMRVLLESGRLNARSLAWMLGRKADWHDLEGMRLVLDKGGDTTLMTVWGNNALHHALRRDNSLKIIELLLDHGAKPALKNRDGNSASVIAARRGRSDVLALFEERRITVELDGVDRLIAACARGDREHIAQLTAREPGLLPQLLAEGGTLLSEFAGNNNLEGVRTLLDLGVSVSEPYKDGDPYFGIPKGSPALHVAAWHAWPAVVKELLRRGASVNATDADGRSPLQLAVKACVDSYWTSRRSPDSVEALLRAGASVEGIDIPSGYDAIDKLLTEYAGRQNGITAT